MGRASIWKENAKRALVQVSLKSPLHGVAMLTELSMPCSLDRTSGVVHAFQKKSKTGIKTPKQEIDLINERLKRLREMLK